MGVPVGHPFFGNQYTDGGYILGTFKYDSGIAGTVFDNSSKLFSNKIDKTLSEILTRQKPKNQILKVPNTKGFDLNILIAGGIELGVFAGGYLFCRHISEKTKAKKDVQQFIELCQVGTCTHCGEPLSGSRYIPESEADSQGAYMICNECGEKNFAWFPDENDSSEKDLGNHNEQVFEENTQSQKGEN
ncbi:MAG: hypothetical protein CVU41_02675 [Chloroflexi bacterium HGW-Chloroflexi-3]|nr:MAG: hypothetical protein CVU41_02675 [Chloroflexi bacterium HGW-Chloroflexi-3]